MLYLGNILQFVVNELNQSPFAKHDLVGDGHERVPHVFLNLGDKLNPIYKKKLKQSFAEIFLEIPVIGRYGNNVIVSN